MPGEEGEFTAAWAKYEREVMAEDAGPNQRLETKRAFYAGGLAIMGVSISISDAPFNPTQMEADIARFDRLWADLREGVERL